MTIQARFLNITWESSDSRLMTISSLNYSFGINTESKRGIDGNDKVVVKGYKKDTIDVTYTVSRNCGVDPEEEHSKACLIAFSGLKGVFILGGKRFGSLLLMILKVRPSNIVYLPDGRISSMDITLTLGEPEEEKEKRGIKEKLKKLSLLKDLQIKSGIKL